MKTLRLDAARAGSFEQFLADGRDETTLQNAIGNASIMYHGVFHEPFLNILNIEDTSVDVSDEELYQWVCWCIFYGKLKEEYPLMNQ